MLFGCVILTLTGCATPPEDVVLPMVQQKLDAPSLTFKDANKLNTTHPFEELDYFKLEKDYLVRNGSSDWHRKGVMNKKTKFISPYQKNALAKPLFQSIEYWLIRKAKSHIEENYFRVFGKQPKKEHKFHPHLYGGVKGYGTIFPIIDNDMKSYTNFAKFLRNKTNVSESTKEVVINSCFPLIAFYKLKTKKSQPTRRNNIENCVYTLKHHNIPYFGIESKTKEKMHVVETFIDEDPTFDAGLYHHLFNSKRPKMSNQTNKTHFGSLLHPNQPNYLVSLSMDNRYVLDLSLAFGDATAVKQINSELFTTGLAQELLGDHTASDLYGSYDLSYRLRSGFHLPQHRKGYQLFENCHRSDKTLPVAYEDFTRIDYQCAQGGVPKKQKNWSLPIYHEPVTARANVTLTTLNERDLLLASYTKVTSATSAYVEIKDVQVKEDITEKLIRRQFHYSFFSWLSVEGNKIYGNVEYYGMLFKYNITDIVKYRLNTGLEHYASGESHNAYWSSKEWQDTLNIFPDLLAKYQAITFK